MSLPTVFVDASPMLDRSGHRGIGRYVYDLLHGLEAIRDEWQSSLRIQAVTGLSWYGAGTLMADLARAAEFVRERRGSEGKAIVWKRRLWLAEVARGADILHLTEALGAPLWRVTRWGVTCYDLIPLRMPEQYLSDNRLNISKRHASDWLRYHRSDHLIAISERTRLDMIEILKIAPEKIDAVPTGIDLTLWSAPAQADDAERRSQMSVGARPYLLFVGEGDARKGVDTMIRALAEARHSLDVELVWVGKLPKAHQARFRAKAEQSGVAEHVRFVGFAPDADLAALYRGALATVFLSVLEGFGLPVAEAIAAGCPVVVARGSGCEEICGEAGCVVPPNDYEAAAHAILELASDPIARAQRSEFGRARAPRYDRRQMARGYVGNWLRMLSEPR